jgi:NitT/TauT family transport system substrate-binding protein
MVFALLLSGLSGTLWAESPDQRMRIGVLAFGTLAWELATMNNEGIAEATGLELEQQTLASSEGGKVALQANSVNMIVSDWLWVSQQREQGADFTFIPYSTAAGTLIVPEDSAIRSLQDLKGKRLGIAGGGLDKNWILLRALAQQRYQLDLDQAVEKIFGAPPLLNQQMLRGNLDALLNFWHFAVKLEARGYRRLLDVKAILHGLGVDAEVPSLGYVVRESWALAHKAALTDFLRASRKAKNALCESASTWEKIVPLTRESDKNAQQLLRRYYCEGLVKSWGDEQRNAAERIYALLHRYGGGRLTGTSGRLAPGTFWSEAVQ